MLGCHVPPFLKLRLGLITSLSFAIVTAKKVRWYTHLWYQGVSDGIKITQVVTTTVGTTTIFGNKDSALIDDLIWDLVFEPFELRTLQFIRRVATVKCSVKSIPIEQRNIFGFILDLFFLLKFRFKWLNRGVIVLLFFNITHLKLTFFDLDGDKR